MPAMLWSQVNMLMIPLAIVTLEPTIPTIDSVGSLMLISPSPKIQIIKEARSQGDFLKFMMIV